MLSIFLKYDQFNDQLVSVDFEPESPTQNLKMVAAIWLCICFLYFSHNFQAACLLKHIHPVGVVGNMLASHAVNPGSITGRGIHSDSDGHYNGGPVSLDAQWHVKEPWRR